MHETQHCKGTVHITSHSLTNNYRNVALSYTEAPSSRLPVFGGAWWLRKLPFKMPVNIAFSSEADTFFLKWILAIQNPRTISVWARQGYSMCLLPDCNLSLSVRGLEHEEVVFCLKTSVSNNNAASLTSAWCSVTTVLNMHSKAVGRYASHRLTMS